jgi:hypothetical protein
MAEAASPPPGAAWPGPRHQGCEPLVAPLRLVIWLRVSSGKIEILQYFLGFSLKVGYLYKNKTPGQFC